MVSDSSFCFDKNWIGQIVELRPEVYWNKQTAGVSRAGLG